ncbi:MAG: hypothetical protein LBB74_02105 [Chitinispirillales bacterium]|jgi:hypothetical protein|nr:hypothetical protein [Chitinispirillales bacterium]
MAAVINLDNPIEVREAGLKALNAALGYRGAQAFIGQYEKVGDFTAEKYDRPEQPFERVLAKIEQASADIRARRHGTI